MSATVETIKSVEEATGGDYKYGFVTDIDSEFAPKGLNEDIVRFISQKKDEPKWLLDWRLKAFRLWESSVEKEPTWANLKQTPMDFQDA